MKINFCSCDVVDLSVVWQHGKISYTDSYVAVAIFRKIVGPNSHTSLSSLLNLNLFEWISLMNFLLLDHSLRQRKILCGALLFVFSTWCDVDTL